jgi:hypothetical protein
LPNKLDKAYVVRCDDLGPDAPLSPEELNEIEARGPAATQCAHLFPESINLGIEGIAKVYYWPFISARLSGKC